MTKRQIREEVIKMLYQYNLLNLDFNFIYKTTSDSRCLELLKNIIDKKNDIDNIISLNLKNYSIKRLNLVDLSIIELCVYEMINGLHKNICINEAIELTKVYSQLDDGLQSKFNNRLLDNIARSINGKTSN